MNHLVNLSSRYRPTYILNRHAKLMFQQLDIRRITRAPFPNCQEKIDSSVILLDELHLQQTDFTTIEGKVELRGDGEGLVSQTPVSKKLIVFFIFLIICLVI